MAEFSVRPAAVVPELDLRSLRSQSLDSSRTGLRNALETRHPRAGGQRDILETAQSVYEIFYSIIGRAQHFSARRRAFRRLRSLLQHVRISPPEVVAALRRFCWHRATVDLLVWDQVVKEFGTNSRLCGPMLLAIDAELQVRRRAAIRFGTVRTLLAHMEERPNVREAVFLFLASVGDREARRLTDFLRSVTSARMSRSDTSAYLAVSDEWRTSRLAKKGLYFLGSNATAPEVINHAMGVLARLLLFRYQFLGSVYCDAIVMSGGEFSDEMTTLEARKTIAQSGIIHPRLPTLKRWFGRANLKSFDSALACYASQCCFLPKPPRCEEEYISAKSAQLVSRLVAQEVDRVVTLPLCRAMEAILLEGYRSRVSTTKVVRSLREKILLLSESSDPCSLIAKAATRGRAGLESLTVPDSACRHLKKMGTRQVQKALRARARMFVMDQILIAKVCGRVYRVRNRPNSRPLSEYRLSLISTLTTGTAARFKRMTVGSQNVVVQVEGTRAAVLSAVLNTLQSMYGRGHYSVRSIVRAMRSGSRSKEWSRIVQVEPYLPLLLTLSSGFTRRLTAQLRVTYPTLFTKRDASQSRFYVVSDDRFGRETIYHLDDPREAAAPRAVARRSWLVTSGQGRFSEPLVRLIVETFAQFMGNRDSYLPTCVARDRLGGLPYELQLNIMQHLDVRGLAALRLCSRALQSAAADVIRHRLQGQPMRIGWSIRSMEILGNMRNPHTATQVRIILNTLYTQ